jgi:signal peptidase I
MRKALWATVIIFLAFAAVLTRFGTRWPAVYYMTGSSMEPTISPRELFLVWVPAGQIELGDLVLFRFTDEDGEYHVLRRVAGLPGDTVAMWKGRAIVNGRPQSWPYRIERPEAWRSPLALEGNLFTWGPWVVPTDSVVLLADTRDMLGWPDSRFVGFVSRSAIVGKAGRALTGRQLE